MLNRSVNNSDKVEFISSYIKSRGATPVLIDVLGGCDHLAKMSYQEKKTRKKIQSYILSKEEIGVEK